MARLELALEHLQGALEALEKAADSAPAAFTPQPNPRPEDHGRIAALEAERQTLLARITALEDELAALSGITQDVETRLDGAIGEIRAALARS